MIKNSFKKIDLFLLIILLTIGLLVRLYKINIPLADFHSWRQADTASVAKNFLKNGFNLFLPQYDDLSSIQSGKENPLGLRMVEFPIYQAIFASIFKIFPVFSIEIYGRLTSIFFTLITASIIYYLLLKESSRTAAFFASFFFLLIPFFIFYTRVILPEPTAVGFAFLAVFFLYQYTQSKNIFLNLLFYFLSIISFASALLIKPTTIFYIFPLVFLFWQKFKKQILSHYQFYLYFLISFLPLFFWREYIKNYPEGIPANLWLLTHVNANGELKNIFFKPAFFRWIFYERINNLIFGGYLTFFFLLGIIKKNKNYFLISFLLTLFFYLFIFQGGNVQHEYYQIIIFPCLAIFVGLGIDFILQIKNKINLIFTYFLIFFSTLFSFSIGFYHIKNHYHYSTSLVKMGKIINSLTNPDDLIVTDRTGDTTLLYLSERRGSPALHKDEENLKKDGYKYLVTENKEKINELKKKGLKIIFTDNQFTIFAL